jgi:hypothetical protein
MEKHRDKLRYASIVALCLINLCFGLRAAQIPMILGGMVGLVYVATTAAKIGSPAPASGELPQA